MISAAFKALLALAMLAFSPITLLCLIVGMGGIFLSMFLANFLDDIY